MASPIGRRFALSTPNKRLFRIGSVSKVLVWIAVMQQVAAGKLDLNADVNSYLQTMQIPYTYPQPITLTHLMTHTAGFEDRLIGLFAYGPMTVGDFHSNLIATMPRRVMIPGHFAAYSNYGAALAAHLVETRLGRRLGRLRRPPHTETVGDVEHDDAATRSPCARGTASRTATSVTAAASTKHRSSS